MGTPVGEKQPKQPSPPKPNHGVVKGLMIGKGPITQGDVCHLLMHKDCAIEMVDPIIKETDLDPCANQTTEDLGASGPFNLSRVCSFFLDYLTFYLSILLLTVFLIPGVGAHESPSG